MRDQLQHDFKGGERFGSPVDGNEGKESMLNLVPLAGGRRIMSYGDREVFFIGQFLQLFLPEPISGPIGAPPSAVISNSFLGGQQYHCHESLARQREPPLPLFP